MARLRSVFEDAVIVFNPVNNVANCRNATCDGIGLVSDTELMPHMTKLWPFCFGKQ